MGARAESAAERTVRVLRRTLLALFGAQLAIAIGMSLVDSYRRRGKKPKPFPTTPPRTVGIGEGTVTTYTYGRDLYEDMLAAIEGAQRQVLFETYIWKATRSVSGSRARWRRPQPGASRSTASTTGSPISSSRPGSSGSRPR